MSTRDNAKLVKRGRCPNDGAKLTGKTGYCKLCGSNWHLLWEGTGTPDAEPPDARDYVKRKLRELDNGHVSPHREPPQSLARRQAGNRYGTLANPRLARAYAEHVRGRDVDTPVIGRQY